MKSCTLKGLELPVNDRAQIGSSVYEEVQYEAQIMFVDADHYPAFLHLVRIPIVAASTDKPGTRGAGRAHGVIAQAQGADAA